MGNPERCPYCDGVVDRTDKECPHCKRRLTGKALLENPPDIVRAAAARQAAVSSATGTKKCPFCAEEIQAAAIVCKHCGRNLDTHTVAAAASGTPEKKKTSVGTLGCATIIAILGLGWCASLFNNSSPTTPARTTPSTSAAPPTSAPPAAKQLALLSSSGHESDGGGYHIVEGQVENISGESLRNVAAVATWYTKDDTFVTSDDSLIDFNPILPGQKSAFKVMSRTNPAMNRYSVSFKQLFGGTIPIDDRRKK